MPAFLALTLALGLALASDAAAEETLVATLEELDSAIADGAEVIVMTGAASRTLKAVSLRLDARAACCRLRHITVVSELHAETVTTKMAGAPTVSYKDVASGRQQDEVRMLAGHQRQDTLRA